MAVYEEYTWLFIVSIFVSIFLSFGGGANDMANAFGSTVGAKALTLRQVVMVACVMEFLGAVLLGASVTDTIRSNIAKTSAFTNYPDLLMYAMFSAMIGAGIWLLFATVYELPVSFTHSIIGGICGATVAAAGWNAVIWYSSRSDFPFVGGLTAVMLGWVFSPTLAGIGSITLWLIVRTTVLRRQNSYSKSLYLLPIFTFMTFFIVTMFIIKKGIPNLDKSIVNDDGKIAWISAIVAVVGAAIAGAIGIPLIRRAVRLDIEAEEKAADPEAAAKAEAAAAAEVPAGEQTGAKRFMSDLRRSKIYTALTYGTEVDVHEVVETDAKIADVHEHSEVFDKHTEFSFKYLQVFTASCNMFAHGSNDVANGIGPLAAIYAIWQTGTVSSKAPVPIWILITGALGMCLGLAILGYKIVRVLGVKMMKLSNSRGFCMELSAAVVVIIASRFGLPVSTTQTITGAITGLGIMESVKSGARSFNWILLVKFFAGWVATLGITGVMSAVICALGIFAPNRPASFTRAALASEMNSTGLSVAKSMIKSDDPVTVEAGFLFSNQSASIKAPVLDIYKAWSLPKDQLKFFNETL